MSQFPIHTVDTAPEPSRPGLLGLQQAVGMIPNLAAGMAEAPTLLRSYLTVREEYQKGTLTGGEIQVLSIVAAVENDCGWCVAFHSLMARNEGVADDVVTVLRDGKSPADARLGALSDFARGMIRRRGAVGQAELDRFVRAGYSRAAALEVVLGMAFSLMANYAGHLVDPPLDTPFEPYAWRRPASLSRTEPELVTS
jgi:AhpD family alkylhydroperoxidase